MGRPRKNPATPTAKNKQPQTAPEAASAPSATKTDNHAAELADAITAALRPLMNELKEHITIAARLAAADTLRTTEKPETVLSRAIREGALADNLIKSKTEQEANHD